MSDRQGSLECAEVEEELAELALGILPGRRRAELLAHVEGCPGCAGTLSELSEVVDALARLEPGAEPPLGFEQRVLERFRPPERTQRSGLRRRAAVAVAVAAAVAGIGLGFGIGAATSSPAGNVGQVQVTSAPLRAGHSVVGRLQIVSGSPDWLLMSFDAGIGSGPVSCELLLGGGKVETVGRFTAQGSYDTWAVPFDVPAASVRGVDLVDSAGHTVASATVS